MKSTALPKAIILSLLSLMALFTAAGCAPNLTREMLTPSPTVTNTPLPSRTPDPNQKPRSTPTPQPSEEAAATPTAAETLRPAPEPLVIVLQGLVLEEYFVGLSTGYDLRPSSDEKNLEFYQKIPPEIFQKNQALWSQPLPPSLDSLNAILEPFDYRLQADEKQGGAQYEVYRGDELLFDHVTYYGDVQVNRSGSDFILPITLGSYEVWILQKDHFELWYAGEPRHLPVFVGDDLVAIGQPEEFVQNGQSVTGVSILVNGQPKFRLALPYQGANMCPIRSLRAWGDQWVLELDGEVLVDGEKLTEKYGYLEVFNWQLINGKPFFLYKDSSSYGIHYGDQELDVAYREIVHWNCVDQQAGNGYNLSAKSNDQIAAFFAMRGMDWNYVEVTRNR